MINIFKINRKTERKRENILFINHYIDVEALMSYINIYLDHQDLKLKNTKYLEFRICKYEYLMFLFVYI